MLTFHEKQELFNSLISQSEKSYADSFNSEIDIHASNSDYNFLSGLKNKEEIKTWLEKLKSRIVMREDEAELQDIIDDYILLG